MERVGSMESMEVMESTVVQVVGSMRICKVCCYGEHEDMESTGI